MRKYRVIPILLLYIIIFSGCANISTNQMIENVLSSAEEPSYTKFYLKKETKTYFDGDLINIQVLETWEDASTRSALHVLADSEGGTFYTIISRELMTLYQEGNRFATVKQVPVLYFNELLSQKKNTISMLEALRQTHKLVLKEEENIGDDTTYHFHAIPREENQLLGEQHLWINQVNWMIMKRTTTIDKKVIVERVLEFDHDIKYANVNYSIPSQENYSLNFLYEPEYEEKIVHNIDAPIYFLEPESPIQLLQTKEILSPVKGYRFTYSKNGADYLQLKVTKKQEITQEYKAPLLKFKDLPVSVHPIPNIGMELTFSDNNYDYEILYMDPLATKQELQSLLNRMIYRK